jgi:hypothetical protein
MKQSRKTLEELDCFAPKGARNDGGEKFRNDWRGKPRNDGGIFSSLRAHAKQSRDLQEPEIYRKMIKNRPQMSRLLTP